MNKLPKNFSEVQEYLSRIKPWAAVAALCAAALLGYYTLQAMRYWEAWDDTRTMTAEIERISRKLDRGLPSTGQVTQDLETRQQRLTYLQSLFEYPEIARLMGIVSTTSWNAGIDLPSISVGNPAFENLDGMRYRTQTLTLSSRGYRNDLYRFLAMLHQEIRVMSIRNVSLANLASEESTGQVQLVFYLSPEPISEEEGSD